MWAFLSFNWGRSFSMLGSCILCLWRRLSHRFVRAVRGSSRSGRQGWDVFFDCTIFCLRCLCYCFWRCWKLGGFVCSKAQELLRSFILTRRAFELLLALLRLFRDLLCWGQLGYAIGTFDGDDELRNDWENFVSSFVEEIIGSKNCEWTVRIKFFSGSIKENGKIVMIVQRLDWNFPVEFRLWILVIDSDREISSVVVPSELWGRDISF